MTKLKKCKQCKMLFLTERSHAFLCSNQCRWRWYKKKNLEKELERHRQWYWQEKKANYQKLREINIRAQNKKRFGITDTSLVFKKDKNRCRNCGSQKKLMIHHIDHNGRGEKNPNNDIDNLVTVCASCHAKHHFHNIKLKI